MLKWKSSTRPNAVYILTPSASPQNPTTNSTKMTDIHNITHTPHTRTQLTKKSRRKSLSILRSRLEEHKENLETNFLRRSLGSSCSPLQDISNGQSPNRTPRQSGQRLIPRQFARTLPTYEAEESPDMYGTSLLRNQPSRRASFSSSQIGDTTLDRLIDAIIESAKKEYPASGAGVDDTPNRSPVHLEKSIHEMEVKTPEGCQHHLTRQKVVRRKVRKDPPRRRQERQSEVNGLTLPDGIPSPETPNGTTMSSEKRQKLSAMETPETMTFVVDSFPGISSKDLQGCSTPSPSKTNSIKRCLHFSPEDMECSDVDGSLNKRTSVASSTCLSSSANSSLGKDTLIQGSIDLAIFADDGKLNVHVIRCRDLHRPNGSTNLNAYVKVALLPARPQQDIGFQRTAVHRSSSRPFFDHRFKFDVSNNTDNGADMDRKIQLAVWHRDRNLKRSEFLGCLSFPLKNVLETPINGSCKLQPQSCLTSPRTPTLTPSHPVVNTLHSSSSKSTSNTINNNNNAFATNEMASSSTTANHQPPQRTASVEEEVISLDGMPVDLARAKPISAGSDTLTLSKKAIHQRDADENLFLRFLELDPPPETTGSGSQGSSGNRRMSTFKPAVGRTPFTITKRLTRTADRGFGFSIVWTHPPRVEKIAPGLSAEKNGILPGDYVIFVEKHNVVTMPEADVLNLIQSQGNSIMIEIFRRTGSSNISQLNASSASSANRMNNSSLATSGLAITCPIVVNTNYNGLSCKKPVPPSQLATSYIAEEMSPVIKQTVGLEPRPPSTVCSNTSLETTKRRLHLPQVTFSKESIAPCHTIDDQRRRILVQVVSREQNFVNTLQFGMQRFATPLQERRDLISPNDHRTLFQNIDELIRISEDILEQLVQDDQEIPLNFASRVYLSKTTAICAAYKKYCNGIKRADCVLVNKSRQPGSEFVSFITEPQVPRKRPDLTMFIHRPLQHFREILKLMQLLASHCRVDSEEHKNFTSVISELQAAYREITVGGGLMEPLGEGRPLLTLQDLESRMVFTRCKPFTLAVQGRQWIFGGDLSRVEGRSVKPYWTLLFSDILVFTKVSRDRVMFITEEPLPIVNIVDSCFNMRKKTTEFRITVDPNGRAAESPTGYCAPDLTRTPKKGLRRKSLILRAPSLELKAVWQNLLQRQIFLVNAALGSTPLSSPLESPDFFHSLVPLNEIGANTASMASVKISSMDSINARNQQNRGISESQQIEQLIDEKCRILNKTGTPKGSAIHLANWMKGQLDKQQEQARLVAAELKEMNSERCDEEVLADPPEDDERITFWTREQLEKRTKELNLSKENGNGKALDTMNSDGEDEIKSPSRSTTSDSQITVRSSPIANNADKLSVCRHCHKNCKKKASQSPTLLCNSLKVQHSQASPNRCCQLSSLATTLTLTNGIASSNSIQTSPKSINMDDQKSNSDTLSTTASTTLTPSQILGSQTSSSVGGGGGGSIIASTSTMATSTTSLTTLTPSTQSSPRTISTKSPKSSSSSHKFIPCNCKCNPEDFQNTTLKADELHHETCRLIDDVSKITLSEAAKHASDLHKDCKCVCKNESESASSSKSNKPTPAQRKDHSKRKEDNVEDPPAPSPHTADDDISLVLIGLAQLTPAARLVNSDGFVPTISVVPPTPDAILSKTSTCIWDNTSTTSTSPKSTSNHIIPRESIMENAAEDSPDESPQDEEPPYKSLTTGLRRYGTLSSLEKVASEDGDEEADEEDDGGDEEEDDDDIEVITREVFGNSNNNPSLRNWTARAGSYVAEKMSFFEESRAFIDKYLGRWNHENGDEMNGEEECLDECTSGATSGEEVWGTPTSGGENDDNMQNSDHTHSSPTKSSSSLTGDDDTELMMDELLMAPPMTASTIRGLLPRRRLEPLFEEESESEEERLQQEDESLAKKGETSANGYDLREASGIYGVDERMAAVPPIQPSMMMISRPRSSERISSDMMMDMIIPPAVSITTTMTMKTTILPTTALNSVVTNEPSSTQRPPPQLPPSVTTNTVHIVRRAKFSPPPPPPRRLLLTQSHLKNTPTASAEDPKPTSLTATSTKAAASSSTDQSKSNGGSGPIADKCSSDDVHRADVSRSSGGRKLESNELISCTETNTSGKDGDVSHAFGENIECIDKVKERSESKRKESNEMQRTTLSSSPTLTSTSTTTSTTPSQSPSQRHSGGVSGLSPRLEMRLALNHDIMGDEDLISYDPGPDLTTILGHDLSRFHRLTGRDLLTRSANRVQPKETVISYSQQRNSKMDTPTLNRKTQRQHHLNHQPQHHPRNPNTWNNSAYVDRIDANVDVIDRNIVNNTAAVVPREQADHNLSDLELLAKQEKIYCMSQLKSGSPVNHQRRTSSPATVRSTFLTESVTRINALNQLKGATADTRTSRFFNFLTRRNSEDFITKNSSNQSLSSTHAGSSTPERRGFSPRKDNDKPSLNRRFWKQITKRRRSNSVTEIAAS